MQYDDGAAVSRDSMSRRTEGRLEATVQEEEGEEAQDVQDVIPDGTTWRRPSWWGGDGYLATLRLDIVH